MYASPDAGSVLSRANENWITVVKATSLGLDVLRDSVRYILVASAVVVAISLIGLILAMCPPSRTRALFAACYLGFGLPSWIFLSFVSVSVLALRDDSERLITLYWKCLQRYAHELGGTGAGPPEPYYHVDAAASICIAAATLLLVGLLTACRVIGWRTLARHSIIWIAGISGLVGAATLGVGIMLKLTSNVTDVFFDGSVMGLGGCVFVVSLIGFLGSIFESKCALRLYALALLLLILAILSVAAYLIIDGTHALEEWLIAHQQSLTDHICSSTMGGAVSICHGMTRDEMQSRAASRLLSITTLLILLVLVLIVDLLMACVLQYLVARYGRIDAATVEMQSLVTAGED